VAVIGDITVSVDGFVTGPDAGVGLGLGRDAEGLHAWALDSDDPVDRTLLEESSMLRTAGVLSGGTARTRSADRRSSW
jgi:hypothetical protein